MPLPPPQDTLPWWSKVIGEPNLSSKPVYVRLFDTTEPAGKEEMTRQLMLYGYVNLHGTYKNLRSGNTGKVVGFRRGNVLQLVFAEDPDAQGRARPAVGSIKVSRCNSTTRSLLPTLATKKAAIAPATTRPPSPLSVLLD